MVSDGDRCFALYRANEITAEDQWVSRMLRERPWDLRVAVSPNSDGAGDLAEEPPAGTCLGRLIWTESKLGLFA
jgi:hypothetical protein